MARPRKACGSGVGNAGGPIRGGEPCRQKKKQKKKKKTKNSTANGCLGILFSPGWDQTSTNAARTENCPGRKKAGCFAETDSAGGKVFRSNVFRARNNLLSRTKNTSQESANLVRGFTIFRCKPADLADANDKNKTVLVINAGPASATAELNPPCSWFPALRF